MITFRVFVCFVDTKQDYADIRQRLDNILKPISSNLYRHLRIINLINETNPRRRILFILQLNSLATDWTKGVHRQIPCPDLLLRTLLQRGMALEVVAEAEVIVVGKTASRTPTTRHQAPVSNPVQTLVLGLALDPVLSPGHSLGPVPALAQARSRARANTDRHP